MNVVSYPNIVMFATISYSTFLFRIVFPKLVFEPNPLTETHSLFIFDFTFSRPLILKTSISDSLFVFGMFEYELRTHNKYMQIADTSADY